MAHAAVEERPPLHMGLPISNGKLAMWLFLVTEIMFFTGLIGTYLILRNGTPASPFLPDDLWKYWIGADLQAGDRAHGACRTQMRYDILDRAG